MSGELIYQKTATDKVLILGERTQFHRQTDLGTDWTELRMGMFASFTGPSGSDNSNSTDEYLPAISTKNKFLFGLKDNGTIFPGESGSSFIGVSNSGSFTQNIAQGSYRICGGDDARMYSVGYKDATIINGGSTPSFNFKYTTDITITVFYAASFHVKLVVNNKGLSNQTVDVYSYTSLTPNYSIPSYSLTNLYNETTTGIYQNIGTVAWNDGISAYTLPDSFFVYAPFTAARLRISAMGVWQIA